MEKIKNLLKKKKVLAVIAVIAVVLVFAIAGGDGRKEVVKADIGSVVQEVAVTGKLVSVDKVDLAFETSGRVESTPVAVGDSVAHGSLLVKLDQSELLATLAKAKASLSQGEAELSELRETSSNAFSDSRANLIAVIKDAFVKTDDAVRNNVDKFFKNQRQFNTYVEFSFVDGGTIYRFPLETDLKLRLSSERWAVEQALISWEKSLNTIDSATSLEKYIVEAENNLNLTKGFMTTMALATNSLTSPSFTYEATINLYKSTVSSARTSVSTALTNLTVAKEKFGQAPKENIGGEFNKVLAKEAQIEQLRAQVSVAQANLSKSVLYSPIAGVVIKQEASVGEIVTSGKNVVSIISDKDFEIEANISEVNIGKVSIGNKVSVVFDALPEKDFVGTVVYIEPSETIIDGVVNFKTKIKLDESDERLKNGLTANIKIETEKIDNVVRIPRYSILEEEGSMYVKKKINSKTIERVPVTIGITGSDGFVEIKSGVSSGDVLVLPLAE